MYKKGDIVKLQDESNGYYIVVEDNSILESIGCRRLYFYPDYTKEENLYFFRSSRLIIVPTQLVRERQIKVLFDYYG